MQISAQRLLGQLRVIVSKEEAMVRKAVWRGGHKSCRAFWLLGYAQRDLRKPSQTSQQNVEGSGRLGWRTERELALSLCGGVCDL